jgi:hypothetical protein
MKVIRVFDDRQLLWLAKLPVEDRTPSLLPLYKERFSYRLWL